MLSDRFGNVDSCPLDHTRQFAATCLQVLGCFCSCPMARVRTTSSPTVRKEMRSASQVSPILAEGTQRKNRLNHQPWCKLKMRDLLVWRCGERSRALSTLHGVLALRVVPMLHCTGPCHEAFLTDWALSVSNETPGQSPVATRPAHVRAQRSL